MSMAMKRMTPRKEAILRLLEHHFENGYDREYADFGLPPYTASTIAREVRGFVGKNDTPPLESIVRPDGTISNEWAFWQPSESTVQSFARTLRQMADEGLLVQVREKKQTDAQRSGR
jgi:hypothetical protein